MIEELQPDDPWGYRRDLKNALNQGDPVGAVMAFVSCMITEVPVSEEMTAQTHMYLAKAQEFVQEDLANCQDAATSLKTRWQEADDDWEAADLVERMLEMRTEAAVLESLYGDAIRAEVAAFDSALRGVSDLLGTIDGSPWVDAWRRSMAALGVDAWWLSVPPVEVEMPEMRYAEILRGIDAWKLSEPAIPGLMAAVTPSQHRIHRFVWESPDQQFRAELEVAAEVAEVDRNQSLFSLVFVDSEGIPTPALDGQSMRLGMLNRTISMDGEIRATIQDFWQHSDGRLFVNDVEWRMIHAPTLFSEEED